MLSVVYQNVHNLINQQHTDDVSWINNGLYYPIRSQSYKTSNRELRGVEDCRNCHMWNMQYCQISSYRCV